jgi:4-amino-4-deoxyprephenate dehydrogenase
VSIASLLVAGAGGLGTLYARELAAEGVQVRGVDPHPPQPGPPWHELLEASVTADLEPRLAAWIATADAVLLAIPEALAAAALATVVPVMKPGALLVDVFAVKAPIAAWLARPGTRDDLEVLSLHPLFAPDLGLRNQNVACVALRGGPRSAWLMARLQARGATLVALDAERHDACTALTQVGTHAALLAFGFALESLDADPTDLLAMSTPVHRGLLGLVARIARLDPEAYWAIQHGHPHAERARAAVAEGLRTLSMLVERGDRPGFGEAMARLRARLGPVLADPRLAAPFGAAATEPTVAEPDALEPRESS